MPASWSGETSPETRMALREQTRASVYRGMPSGRDLGAMEQRFGRDRVIAEFAGTTDRQSPAWKTARDTLTRYRSGRRSPGARNAARLDEVVERNRTQEIRDGGIVTVTIQGDFLISKNVWRGGTIRATLTGPAVEGFADALDGDDHDAAVQVVLENYSDDVADKITSIEALHHLEIE